MLFAVAFPSALVDLLCIWRYLFCGFTPLGCPGDLPVPADLLAALLVPRLLRNAPGAAVLYDVRCSWVVKEGGDGMLASK